MKNIVLLFLSVVLLNSCETTEPNNNPPSNNNAAVTVNTPNAEEVNKVKSISDWKNDIKNNTDWLAQVVEKAKKNNKTVDAQILEDALWAYNNVHKDDKTFKTPANLDEAIANIRANSEWMMQIEEKAAKGGIPVDDQIKSDAQWTLDNTKKDEK